MKRCLSLLWISILLLSAACTAVLPQTGSSPEATEAGQPATASPSPAASEPAAPTVEPTAAAATQPPGKTASAVPQPETTDPPAAAGDEEGFGQELANAIVSQDLDEMRARMGERFVLAYWRSEGRELDPDEALAELEQYFFTPGADPVTDFSIDLAGLLEGADPLPIFGPDAVRAFHVTGLGPGADQQGIAAIARDPATGRLEWRGLLLIAGGSQDRPQLGDLISFAEGLAQAIEARDFTALRSRMKDRFSIATWNTQLLEFTSEEALQQLSEDTLSAGSSPAVIFGTDVAALLEGTDPLSLWGPVANTVRALHVMGLGHQSNEEAVIVIGLDEASGQFYWHGILLPPDGYFHTEITPEPGEVVPTDVQYVMAMDDVNVRSGPGLNYAVEGMVSGGQIAQVSGRSADGDWWRIVCTQDASGFCWISADPELTEPTTAP